MLYFIEQCLNGVTLLADTFGGAQSFDLFLQPSNAFLRLGQQFLDQIGTTLAQPGDGERFQQQLGVFCDFLDVFVRGLRRFE